jgi:hypothetical protein
MWGKALIAAVAAVCATSVVAPAVNAEETGGVSGWVWFDRDENRSFDTTDAPRAGIAVTVHEVATGVDRAAVTNAEGYFSLDGLPLGEYDVTAPDDGYRSVLWPTMRVELTDSRPRSTYFPQVGGRIWGRAWQDVNGDGVRQVGEPGLRASFTLFGPSDFEGDITREFSSDVDGDYELPDVPSGSYRIKVVSPDGMVGTQYRAPGSEWYTDSDFVGTTEPVTEPFELPVAWWEANIDAGFVAV